jgi:hypothetical protein
MRLRRILLLAIIIVCHSSFARADFSAEWRYTMGMSTGIVISSRFVAAIKGDRMMIYTMYKVDPRNQHEYRTYVLDLAAETFTEIYHKERVYSTVKVQQLAEAMRLAQASQKKSIQWSLVKKDQTKQIMGLRTSLQVTARVDGKNTYEAEEWLASEVPGYEEVVDFAGRSCAMASLTAAGSKAVTSLILSRMLTGMIPADSCSGQLQGIIVVQRHADPKTTFNWDLVTLSRTVDASAFEVPPGFKAIESREMERLRKLLH